MNLIAIIPAKGISVRVPHKNLTRINGKSLTERAIDCAIKAEIFDEIIVSSESETILNKALSMGAIPYARPYALCLSGIETAQVVFDVLAWLRYEPQYFCVLNPTSPLRTPELLRQIWVAFKASRATCLLTFYDYGKDIKRHDGTAIFCETGGFLQTLDFHRISSIFYEISYEMSVDINTMEDLLRAEIILLLREGDNDRRDSGA